MDNFEIDQHIKTVYAHFGLAAYLAQVLEAGLAIALVSAELLPRRAGKPVLIKDWEREYNAFMVLKFRQTLGRLIRGLREVTTVPEDLEELLSEALEKRNFLTHHFFRDRAEAFMSNEGRVQMIAELQEAQKLFEKADERLSEVERPLREKYCLSDEKIKPYIDAYLKKHASDL